MRKLITINLILILLTTLFMLPVTYEAKTLGDLRNELQDLKNQAAQKEQEKFQTEVEIQKTKSQIAAYQSQIADGRKKIKEAKQKIIELTDEIKEKEEEVKELVRFLQIANGENAYLEYIFGATSMSDLINRLAIVEQISTYNNELIDEMNELIKENKKLQKDLEDEEKKLTNKISENEKLIRKLGSNLTAVTDVVIDIDKEIAAMKQRIKDYEDRGCKDHQDLDECSFIPLDTGFSRPIGIGYISSGFGWRSWNGGEMHYAIDIAPGKDGYNVYPTAAGRVSSVIKKSSCGGNAVYIDHIINGKKYSSVYMHLLTVNVKVNQVVERDTIIGKNGGGRTTALSGCGYSPPTGYDYCTCGAHLHFGIAEGHYKGYYSWIANAVDPTDYIYFPKGWFNSR